jgi:nucleotide-binding universal stress UspA family protein
MSIVCATSFSERSTAVVRAAAALAGRLGEPLALVHAVPREEQRGPATLRMDDALRSLRARAELVVEGEVVVGPAAEAVARFADARRASLLVMAGAPAEPSGLEVTDAVLQHCTIPCLVVREAGPFEAWASRERPLKVMLGVDASVPFAAARAFLARLAAHGPISASAAHVYWPPAEYARLGLPQPLMFTEPDPALEKVLSGEVAHEVGTLAPDVSPRVRLRIGMGWTGDQLVAMAKEEGADLLVVGSHRRHGVGKLWSVSQHVVWNAPMSVASIPAEAAPRAAAAEIPEMTEVLAATDFSPSGDQAVPYAFSIVQPGGTVHLVHARPIAPSEEDRRKLEQQLRALVPAQAAEQAKRAAVEVVWGEPSAAIASAAERMGADAICVGSHARRTVAKAVLGSVSQALLGKTRRPVLVVPRKAE